MRNLRRSAVGLAAIAASLAFVVALGAAADSGDDLSSKEEDAFILYKYSLMDARSDRSPDIAKNREGNKTTYEYAGHALSCRTVMNGFISETALEDRTHVVGNFEVSNNSFGITKLSFDFYDEGERTRTGTMTVDDKVIDIKHFDRR